ncbi:hypothetical protein [Nocardia aurantia]|nr:hypothetical protein [Nocardia aurantia]
MARTIRSRRVRAIDRPSAMQATTDAAVASAPAVLRTALGAVRTRDAA